jgi:hypothetical protein
MANLGKDGKEIRYHGTNYVDLNVGDDGMITLTSDGDDCTLKIPDGFWMNIMDGSNFTHIIDTEEKIKQYIKDHSERFQFVGHTAGPVGIGGSVRPLYIDETRWHLVF